MKQNLIIKSLLLSAAFAGLTAAARADEPRQAAPVPASGTMGLLGQTYAGLTYTYVNLDQSPANADRYQFELNQPIGAGLDGMLTYDWMQTGLMAGMRLNQQTISGTLRAFSPSYAWGKPYVEAGAGYTWTKFAGTHDNSLVWEAAVGAEFQAAPAFTVTPFIQFRETPDLARGSTWNFGVKANYWVTSQWAVTVGLNHDDSHNTGFTVGTNFRF